MARVKKLTPRMLKRMVLQEKRRLRETLEQGKDDASKVDAEEADADEAKIAPLKTDYGHLSVLKSSQTGALYINCANADSRVYWLGISPSFALQVGLSQKEVMQMIMARIDEGKLDKE